jgi:hypothetical protein
MELISFRYSYIYVRLFRLKFILKELLAYEQASNNRAVKCNFEYNEDFWVIFFSHFIIITFSDMVVTIQEHLLLMAEEGVSGNF